MGVFTIKGQLPLAIVAYGAFKISRMKEETNVATCLEGVNRWLQIPLEVHPLVRKDCFNGEEVCSVLEVEKAFGNQAMWAFGEWEFHEVFLGMESAIVQARTCLELWDRGVTFGTAEV